ncbi:DUF1878 family protein [Ornithinibacillus halophilus]|uniref:DUF1878 domain-containing protein n=1 Tax=Ornithinibacillus halophilus TaxID=930117 RepID=A0A1M5LQD1_9BACI|nr:DUF1878 family protein [Ornithinibacillus halophilus]SHG66819.1 Protein of unknown function [Ornithinibacillus halophilus]
MEKLNENDNTTSFHLQLLSKTLDLEKYPFIQLVIIHNITNAEYKDILNLLHSLEEKYEQQKEEGLLDFTSLLVQFAGMLNEKLDPTETIFALYTEGYFPTLMEVFIEVLQKEGK